MELNQDTITVSVPYEYLYRPIQQKLTEENEERIRLVLWTMKDGAEPEGASPEQLDMVVLPFHTVTEETTWQYISTHGLEQILARASNAQLFQAPSIGIEGLQPCIPSHGVLANAVGVMEAPTAELGVTLLLAVLRGIPGFIRTGAEWDNHTTPGLIGKRVLILGYGGVGTHVERMVETFGAETVRVASRARVHDDGRQIHSIDELHTLLPEVDAVVCTLPLNAHTEGLMNAQVFTAMKRGAAFVNIGRGAVVDAASLLEAVDARGLRVALDVTEPEPLPEDHPLWNRERVLITPHVGGNTDASHAFLRNLLISQMRAILSGETPVNIVAGSS